MEIKYGNNEILYGQDSETYDHVITVQGFGNPIEGYHVNATLMEKDDNIFHAVSFMYYGEWKYGDVFSQANCEYGTQRTIAAMSTSGIDPKNPDDETDPLFPDPFPGLGSFEGDFGSGDMYVGTGDSNKIDIDELDGYLKDLVSPDMREALIREIKLKKGIK